MRKANLTVAACAALLWASTALAAQPQQLCDYARIKAWAKYVSCVDGMMAKRAEGVSFDDFGALARCRHRYFQKWTAFQTNTSLLGSTCQPGDGARFVDNGDGTVTDKLTTLVWEKKTNLDFTENYADPHDADNTYTWSTDTSYKENGTAFTSFLATVNSGGFGGANGWRLPTFTELETIVKDFPCTGHPAGAHCLCPSYPCVDATLDSSNTQSRYYWSATGYVGDPPYAWGQSFDLAGVNNGKTGSFYVRAVRGGL